MDFVGFVFIDMYFMHRNYHKQYIAFGMTKIDKSLTYLGHNGGHFQTTQRAMPLGPE